MVDPNGDLVINIKIKHSDEWKYHGADIHGQIKIGVWNSYAWGIRKL